MTLFGVLKAIFWTYGEPLEQSLRDTAALRHKVFGFDSVAGISVPEVEVEIYAACGFLRHQNLLILFRAPVKYCQGEDILVLLTTVIDLVHKALNKMHAKSSY